MHARQCRLCLLFSVLAVCGMVLGVWHAPIDLYGHPVPPDFANVVCLMCWFWFGPAAAGLGLLALGDLLTNSSVPEDHKRFTLVCVAAGAVVVMFLGPLFCIRHCASLASARNCTPNVVLSSGTNMFQGFLSA